MQVWYMENGINRIVRPHNIVESGGGVFQMFAQDLFCFCARTLHLDSTKSSRLNRLECCTFRGIEIGRCARGVKRAQGQCDANLHGVVEVARIKPGERSNLIEPVAQRVAMDVEAAGGRRGTAIFGEEDIERVEQFDLVVERTEQMDRQIDLGALIRDADKRRDAEGIQTMHAVLPMKAAAKRERGAGILVGGGKRANAGVITSDANGDRRAGVVAQAFEQCRACALERAEVCLGSAIDRLRRRGAFRSGRLNRQNSQSVARRSRRGWRAR